MQTQGRVTQEDINRVFYALKQLPNYNMGMSMLYAVLPLFMFCFFIGFFLFLYFFAIEFIADASEDRSPLILPFILVGIVLLALLVIIGLSIGINYHWRYRLNKRTEEIKKCLDDFNQKEFAAKEVSWKAGTLAAWI